MFKGIGNLLSSAASYLDKSKNTDTDTTEETEAKNKAKTEVNSAVEHSHATIGDRKTSAVKPEMNSDNKENEIIDLLQDAIEDEDRIPELAPDIDFELEAEHITREDAKLAPVNPDTILKPVNLEDTSYSKALGEIVDPTIFYKAIIASYKVIAGSSNLENINTLIDGFNNDTALSKDLLNRLSQIDQTEFYKLLTSQIIAKNPDVAYYNTFVNYLSKLKDYIESHPIQSNDTINIKNLTNKIEEIIKTVINDAFKQIKQNDIINTEALNKTCREEDVKKYSTEKAKNQFIVDLARFNINFKLIHQQQEFWNSRELEQDYSKLINVSLSKSERDTVANRFFHNCHSKITECILKHNPEINQEVINATLIELTQAGLAVACKVADALKDSIFKYLLLEDSKYSLKPVTNSYAKEDTTIDVSESGIRISTSCTFDKGISLYTQEMEPILNSGPITISYTLEINPKDATDTEYKDIIININSKQLK